MDPKQTTVADGDGAGDTPDPSPPEPPRQPPARAPQQPPRQQLQPSDLQKIRQGERRKGMQMAREDADREARRAGFKDYDHMKRTAMEKRNNSNRHNNNQPQRNNQPQPQRSNGGQSVGALQRENQQLRQQVQSLTQKYDQAIADKRKAHKRFVSEEKARKALSFELDAERARWELKLIAMQHGVRDVDYAVDLLQRRTRGMSDEELNAFEEQKYFSEELRKSHPYLYGEEKVPAHTSAKDPAAGEPKTKQNGGAGHSTPAPAAKGTREQREGAQEEVKDARSVSRDEFSKMLKEHGLQDPSASVAVPGGGNH